MGKRGEGEEGTDVEEFVHEVLWVHYMSDRDELEKMDEVKRTFVSIGSSVTRKSDAVNTSSTNAQTHH